MIADTPPVNPPTPAPARSRRSGPLGLLLTLGAKGSKAVVLVKAALAAASFGLYSVVFTWQFALLILISIFVHENGHIWAMKRCGMKTRGIYFIPFIGGAAIADSAFRSRREEVFVAIMGPIWGLALALVSALLYLVTRNALWAAAAEWIAFINLFNLFPVNPLDGGRIVKSIAFSFHSWIGLGVMLLGFIAAFVAAVLFGYGLLVFVVAVGALEFAGEVGWRRRRLVKPPMRLPGILASSVSYVTLAAVLLGLMVLMGGQPGAGLATSFLHS
ncbi:MAG TPA: site-2 protease family protein [Chloroflexota bacterium]|nr:site-2 protease family protein [Chloroflexota bacterium]